MIRNLTRGIAILLLCASFASDAVELSGIAQQGGLLIGQAGDDVRIEFDGYPVRIADNGTFILALGRDAPSRMELLVYDKHNNKTVQVINVTQREYPVQKIEGVPQRTVTPPPEALARIRKEGELVRNARALDDVRMDFIRGFAQPIDGVITGVYGSQRVYNGVPKRPHFGLDIAAPTGTPVHAPAAGLVTLVHPDMYYSGGTLIIDHGHGLSSTFIHLSKILVEEGQRIEPGDIVAEVGATGRATGPHLDWRMNWFDVRVDPQQVMQALPATTP